MGRLNKKTGKKLNTANHDSPDSFNLPEVSARRYQELFNNASDAIFIRDLKGNITEVNEAAVTITGYTHNELKGMNVSEFLTAESFKATMKKQKALLEDETATQRYELEIIRKDGGRMNAESRTNLLTYNGRPLGVQCIVRDITERKRAEEALRLQSEIVANMAEGVVVTRASDGVIVYTNQRFEKMFGYGKGELLGKYVSVLNAPGDKSPQERAKEIIKSLSETGVWYGEVYNIKKDGTPFWCQASVSTLEHAQLGKVWVATHEDITERKRAKEALQASEERYRTVADFTYDWEYWIGPDGDFRYISPSCERMTGYRVDEFLRDPKLLDRIIHPDDYPVIAQHINGEFKSKEVLHADFRIISRSGEERWIAHWCQPVYGNDGSWLGRRGSNRDITQRKRAEEALRDSEKNFRNSLDSSPLGIRIVTAKGELLYANRAILDIYGYSSVGKLKAMPIKQRYTPKGYAEFKKREKSRKLGKPVPADYEISIVRKDGEVRHLAVFRKEVIWDSKIQFQTLYQDITEQKLTAEELKIFKAISDRAGYGAAIITPEGELIYISESFARMHGYTIEELIGKHLSIFHTREQMKLVERLNKKLIQKGSYAAQEVWHKKKDGTVFPTLMTGTAIKDDMGKSLYLSATAIDITEQKQVETALRQSEEFNSSLLTNSPSPILVLNADASIRYVNPALEKLTGFSSAQLIGSKPPYPWWMEETREELSRRLAQAIRLGAKKYEFLFRKKNGERFWVKKTFKTVRVNGEFKYHLVNWVDLTEQKRLKANMEFYLAEITKAQEEERKRIAREIHDESIQSLATLALGIDAITREEERLPKDIIRRLKGLRVEANGILDGLRCFSHELRPGVIDQVGLVPALEILTEELNKEKMVKAILEITGSERRPVPETELALFRIAQEALRNVKKHSRATKTAIRLKFTRSRVKLTVSDNGRGFELPDTLSDLAAEGKLGLIGMQERTRLLGGKLLVRSWAGRGTTVVVEVANIG